MDNPTSEAKMSIELEGPLTDPKGLRVKTWGILFTGNAEEVVSFGDYEVGMSDFLAAAYYILTNSNLQPDDPRLKFVEAVRSMEAVELPGIGSRLHSSDPTFRVI